MLNLNNNNNNNNNNNSEFIIYSDCQCYRNLVFTHVYSVVNILIEILYYIFAVQLYYTHKESKQIVAQQSFLFIVTCNYK